jgi:hypothetical protein
MSTSEHAAAPRAEREKHMSVTGAAFIGFGSMVGAGLRRTGAHASTGRPGRYQDAAEVIWIPTPRRFAAAVG